MAAGRRVVADTTLDRQFDVETHDRVWRRIAGWCLQSRKTTDIVLQALLMACDADS